MQYKTQASLSRRQFGKIALATGVASAIGTSLTTSPAFADEKAESGSEGSDSQWIDAHVHVWTPDVKMYPLDENFAVTDMQPPSFSPEELFAHCKPAGVNRIVLIQMSFYRYDNSYMTDMISKHKGVFSGVGIVDHSADDVADQMKKLASQGVRGFRINGSPKSTKSWIEDAGMETMWKTAAEENLSVCPLINPGSLEHIDALCKKHPKTRVVIDHFARIGVTGTIEGAELDSLCGLAKHPHVHVKTSAFYALGKKKPPYKDLLPMIRRVCDAFTPQRLMWASDCPYQVQEDHNYATSIELIRDHADFLSATDKSAILQGTAEKVFFE